MERLKLILNFKLVKTVTELRPTLITWYNFEIIDQARRMSEIATSRYFVLNLLTDPYFVAYQEIFLA